MIKKVFFVMALLFTLAWALGYFVFGANKIIHCVLMISILFYLQAIINGENLRGTGEKTGEVKMV